MARLKGAGNRDMRELRDFIDEFIMGNAKQLRKDYLKLTPAERFKLFSDLLKYRLPRLNAVTVEETNPKPQNNINLSVLSTEDLTSMIDIADKIGVKNGEEIDFNELSEASKNINKN